MPAGKYHVGSPSSFLLAFGRGTRGTYRLAREERSEWCDEMLESSIEVREDRMEVVLHV